MTRGRIRIALAALLITFTSVQPVAAGGAPPRGAAAPLPPSARPAEERAAGYFAAVRDDPPLLDDFLRRMPKGGDLHTHLSGAVYAESYIVWAAEEGLCVERATLSLLEATCDAAAGLPPAADALADATLFDQLIEAWSMRNFAGSFPEGHDHFFASFSKFGEISWRRTPHMIAEVARRAASQNILYLELMLTLDGGAAGALGRSVGWDDDLPQLRQRLLAAGLPAVVETTRRGLDATEAQLRDVLRCDTPAAEPACGVTIRYLNQITRVSPRDEVFGRLVTSFELAAADPRIVGLNLVAPEDHPVALADYDLHMRMLDLLHTHYPAVGITLHAGELVPGLPNVTPDALCCHIWKAVVVGHARRIGHGVDVLGEHDPVALLAEMARRRVLVEINLTSNDVILGVRGSDHPFMAYVAHGVPVTLATDDEGVARIDLTHEYARAATTYAVGYPFLKQLSRNSLEHSFLPGASLWQDPLRDHLNAATPGSALPAPACSRDVPGSPDPSPDCRRFLAESARASLQWELEARFHAFERAF